MVRYSDELIEEIRNSKDIVDIISQYVVLKRSGRNYFGLCPFHKEKSPSFSVSADRQYFHCFGCHKGGDVFTFVSEIERISFRESLEFLAERARISLPTVENSEFNKTQYFILSFLSIESNEKKYVILYYDVRFNPATRVLSIDETPRVNPTFLIDDKTHSLSYYIDINPYEFVSNITNNLFLDNEFVKATYGIGDKKITIYSESICLI